MGLLSFLKKGTAPKYYVLGCYDHDRVAAISLFQPDFYSPETVIQMVRKWQQVADTTEVKYYEPKDWNAPFITATSDSFACSIDALYRQAEQYLAKIIKIDPAQISSFSRTNIPYPNQGLLLLVYKTY